MKERAVSGRSFLTDSASLLRGLWRKNVRDLEILRPRLIAGSEPGEKVPPLGGSDPPSTTRVEKGSADGPPSLPRATLSTSMR